MGRCDTHCPDDGAVAGEVVGGLLLGLLRAAWWVTRRVAVGAAWWLSGQPILPRERRYALRVHLAWRWLVAATVAAGVWLGPVPVALTVAGAGTAVGATAVATRTVARRRRARAAIGAPVRVRAQVGEPQRIRATASERGPDGDPMIIINIARVRPGDIARDERGRA
jgi:hypothetical protein